MKNSLNSLNNSVEKIERRLKDLEKNPGSQEYGVETLAKAFKIAIDESIVLRDLLKLLGTIRNWIIAILVVLVLILIVLIPPS